MAHNLVVVWRVTELCDLACPFCAYSIEIPRPRASAKVAEALRFGKLLGGYAQVYGRSVMVSWLGGEPLLWKPLLDISRTFRHEFGLQVSVTTNGTRLGKEAVLDQIVSDFSEITVSVDAIGAEHDQWRGQPGLYDRIAESVGRIKAQKLKNGQGPRLRVNMVLMRDTIHLFESLCSAIAEWGVEELTFNALGGRDRPEFYPEHCLRPEQIKTFREQLPRIRTQMGGLGLAILGSERYLDRLGGSAQGDSIPVYDCAPGTRFLFIDERGVIAPCSFTTGGYGVHLSEVLTPNDLHELPGRFTEQKRRATLAPCYDCHSTQVFGKFEHADCAPQSSA